jgi:hypothetical protein
LKKGDSSGNLDIARAEAYKPDIAEQFVGYGVEKVTDALCEEGKQLSCANARESDQPTANAAKWGSI